jgi:hypothetical protein
MDVSGSGFIINARAPFCTHRAATTARPLPQAGAAPAKSHQYDARASASRSDE